MRKRATRFAVAGSLLVLSMALAGGDAGAQESSSPFSAVGIAVKASFLGPGVEAATRITRRLNLRGGINGFSYDRTFNKDGIAYAGQLQFRSAEAHLDWFPFGKSFHLSPGALIYNGNQITANASVGSGQSFTLNSTSYTSDPANPVVGTGKIAFNRSGPMFTMGFGNLVRRSHRFSVPFEIGAIYTGAPNMTLNLTGSACNPNGENCSAIATSPSIQANVQAEQNKINKDVSAFKFYPVISIGFGVKL
ncbi:MAG TPA: hypothetical protein VMD99_07825 [Terriglobales bacterium]|nr:hypothetical protein [Terriglobales bacterium]